MLSSCLYSSVPFLPSSNLNEDPKRKFPHITKSSEKVEDGRVSLVDRAFGIEIACEHPSGFHQSETACIFRCNPTWSTLRASFIRCNEVAPGKARKMLSLVSKYLSDHLASFRRHSSS